MELTNEQKTAAVREEYTKRMKAREIYAELADVGDEDARRKLEKTDDALRKLSAEAARLEAERRGASDPLLKEAGRRRAAEQHTRAIEDGFHADLARMGHGDGHTPDVRRQIEEKALAYVRDHHGEPAAEYCRRLLAPEEPDSPLDDLASVPRLP